MTQTPCAMHHPCTRPITAPTPIRQSLQSEQQRLHDLWARQHGACPPPEDVHFSIFRGPVALTQAWPRRSGLPVVSLPPSLQTCAHLCLLRQPTRSALSCSPSSPPSLFTRRLFAIALIEILAPSNSCPRLSSRCTCRSVALFLELDRRFDTFDPTFPPATRSVADRPTTVAISCSTFNCTTNRLLHLLWPRRLLCA